MADAQESLHPDFKEQQRFTPAKIAAAVRIKKNVLKGTIAKHPLRSVTNGLKYQGHLLRSGQNVLSGSQAMKEYSSG